jgi:hypothetical protein
MDSQGWTLGGEIRRAATTDKLEAGNDLLRKTASIKILQAFAAAKEGSRYDAALAAAKQIRDEEKTRRGWGSVADSLERLLIGLKKREKGGIPYEELLKAPKPVQKEFREKVKQDIATHGKIPLKKAQ